MSRISRRSMPARALLLALGASLVIPAAASADAIQQDVDFVAPGKDDQIVHLGQVEPGATIDRKAKFRLVCNRFHKGKVYRKHVDQGQVLSIDFIRGLMDGVVDPGATATDVTFPAMPASWPDDGTRCPADPPRLAPLNDSQVSFTAPAAPGKHELRLRYADSLAPPQADDAGDIVGSPPMMVRFTMKVVSNKTKMILGLASGYAKGIVDIQEVDADTARLNVAWRKKPAGRFTMVGSTQPCSAPHTGADKVFAASRAKLAKFSVTVPTATDVTNLASLRLRKSGVDKLCRNVVPSEAVGAPFPSSKLKGSSRVGKPKAKGLIRTTEIANGRLRHQVAWRTRPRGTHTLIGSTAPCGTRHTGRATTWLKGGVGAGAWTFAVPQRKKYERTQSVRVKIGGKQRFCMPTTIIANS